MFSICRAAYRTAAIGLLGGGCLTANLYSNWRKNKVHDLHKLSSFYQYCGDTVFENIEKLSSFNFNSIAEKKVKKTEYPKEKIFKDIMTISQDENEIVKRALKVEYGAWWYFRKYLPFTPSFLLNPQSCGATGRAVFHVMAENFKKQLTGVELKNNSELLEKLKKDGSGLIQIVLSNHHLKNQKILGHIILIEKLNQNEFRIYQSFAKHYSLANYLSGSRGHIYTQREIQRYIQKINLITQKGQWDPKSIEAFREAFLVNPELIGLKGPDDQWKCQIAFHHTNDQMVSSAPSH